MSTLKRRLEEVVLYRDTTNPDYRSPEELARRKEVLDDFFEDNTLARDVYLGRDHYIDEVDFIVRKYSGANRIFNPNEDSIFDSEVERILISMNRVGAGRANINLYKTTRKRKFWDFSPKAARRDGSRALKAAIVVFAALPLLTDTFYFWRTGQSLGVTAAVFKQIPFELAATYVAMRAYHLYSERSDELNKLKSAARQTDWYLRSIKQGFEGRDTPELI